MPRSELKTGHVTRLTDNSEALHNAGPGEPIQVAGSSPSLSTQTHALTYRRR